MFRVPPEIINALNSVTKRRVRIEWSNNRFVTYEQADVSECEFTCDSTSQIRWTAKVSLINADSRINNKTTHVRAFLEIKGMRAPWQSIPMGVYRVWDVTTSGPFSDLTLEGYEAIVRDHTFHVPRTLPIGKADSRQRTVEKLLRESIPNVPIVWMAKETTARMEKVTIAKDRWSIIDGDGDAKSITKSLAADCYADRTGKFVIAPTPVETNTPVWSITVDSGVKVSSATTLSRENMKNVWTVWAAPSNSKTVIGPVHVWDNGKLSDTYAGPNPIKYGARDASPFGIVSGHYQNPLLKTTRECEKVGRKRLALSLASRRKVTITSIFNPTLDADDCIALNSDGTMRVDRFIVEKVSYQIDDALTDLQLREQGPPALAESEDEAA